MPKDFDKIKNNFLALMIELVLEFFSDNKELIVFESIENPNQVRELAYKIIGKPIYWKIYNLKKYKIIKK